MTNNNQNDLHQEEEKLEDRVEKLEAKTFDIAFEHENKYYKGWATPSDKSGADGNPTSYHVVLNDIFFGNLSFNSNIWETDSQREDELVQAAGNAIAKHI